MRKKIFAVVLAAVMLCGCVAGCHSPGETDADTSISSTTTTTVSRPSSVTSRTTLSTYFPNTPNVSTVPSGTNSTANQGTSATTGSSPNISVVPGTNRPVYLDNQELTIYAYAGPRSGGYQWKVGDQVPATDPIGGWDGFITEKDFMDYKNAGFTMLYPEYDAPFYSAEAFDGSVLETYMELADKVGLDVLVYSPSLTEWTSSSDSVLTATQKHYLSSLLSTLSVYDSFVGITMRDEPRDQNFGMFKAVTNYVNQIQPGLSTLTAMLPVYGQSMLSTNSLATYKQYIKDFGQLGGIFCYDFYPLRWSPSRGNYLKTQWFNNLELAAGSGLQNGFDLGVIIQSCAYGPIGGEGKVDHARSITTKADVGFQLYTALAYGAKTIGYFTYWQHRHNGHPEVSEAFYDAMVMYPEKNGQPSVKTAAYYAVQAANNEIKKFDHVLMNFEWQGTMALRKTDPFGLLSEIGYYMPPRITSASATADAIIGHLKDAVGNDGYMIVNATEPSQGISSKVTVTFQNATAAIAYVDGAETVITLTNGSYTFHLPSGAGVFVIPYIA